MFYICETIVFICTLECLQYKSNIQMLMKTGNHMLYKLKADV